jgi:predicted ATPase
MKETMTEQASPLFFSNIRIANWRNFVAADADLQLRAFLVGPNASGKSNFLDVFRFLHDIVAVGGGFEQAIESRGGVSSVRALAGRYPSDVVIDVEISEIEAASPRWRYELHFSQDKQRRPIIRKERVVDRDKEILTRPDRDDVRDPQRLRQTFLEQVNVNQRFREIARFFSSVRYLHIVPQLIRESDRYVGRGDDPYGSDFLEQVASVADKTQKARLRQIEKALKIAVPKLSDLEMTRDVRGRPHLRAKYSNWRPQGAWQTEEQFSDGTLRLLGLLWAALERGGPLLLEEPELSLHPEVNRFLPQMFARVQRRSRRQIILSTHSADLLSDTGLGLDEVLLLIPEKEGTSVRAASTFRDIYDLVSSGASLAEAALPKTRPENASQLPLFAEGR